MVQGSDSDLGDDRGRASRRRREDAAAQASEAGRCGLSQVLAESSMQEKMRTNGVGVGRLRIARQHRVRASTVELLRPRIGNPQEGFEFIANLRAQNQS